MARCERIKCKDCGQLYIIEDWPTFRDKKNYSYCNLEKEKERYNRCHCSECDTYFSKEFDKTINKWEYFIFEQGQLIPD